MRLQMNEYTESKIKEKIGEHPGSLRLVYDTINCGCNGVVTLQIADQPWETDVRVESDQFEVWTDRQQEQQFDPVMKLEAEQNYPSFKLSSDGAVFSRNLRVTDMRQQAAK
ncbi:iron-sulfur cluster biosynthesis family protein [Saccharibacillus sp. JS10]|uniref:iron-sulfur cluster biosynthesis family protein n=1 Tax=Saccharibacillus sp. JS10 TaxID=2950552 RepID=UPI00210BB34E|nr:iron-sulfur cluster biosynthesis family protein [Saccharibacillus sp. JS10]MCQ4087683.1 iron-sulfur cluster biosynthesis family protein [Saccharibacillus sp. JS10]